MANQDGRTQNPDTKTRPQPQQQDQARDKSAAGQKDQDLRNGGQQNRQPDQNAGSRH